MSEVLSGGCRCGGVRFQVEGNPVRSGICHCTDCRQESGSAFTYYAIWPRSAFRADGPFADWEGRSFCPTCGSRLFSLTDEEAEVKLGVLDAAPAGIAPTYELWTIRREPWLAPLPGAEQHERDRPVPGG